MRLLYKIITAVFSLLPAASSCLGQYYFKQYQVGDGLSHNAVTAIMQDSKGLMWIGTRNGLNRFDGYTFKTCTYSQDQFGRIGNNIINTIAEDKNGMIWIGTGKGLFKYDPYKELVFEIEKAPKEFTSNLIIDKENNLWFLVNFTLFKYTPTRDTIENLKTPASCIAFDSTWNMWMGDNDGNISLYDQEKKQNGSKITIVPKSLPVNARSVFKIYPIANNKLLIGCFKQGLKSYDTKTGEVTALPLRNDTSAIYVRDITVDNDGLYWIATESGIYIYDLAHNTSRTLQKQYGTPYAITDNAVYILCKDNRGGMWVGTFFGGINYCSKENARFEKFYPIPGVNSISGEAVREICADSNNNLWIGTEDAGLNKLNLKNGQFTNYLASGKKDAISYPNIHGLLAWDDKLFIGPFLQGMEIMDIRTGAITDRFKLIGNTNDQVSDFVIKLYRTRENRLLVGAAYHGSSLLEYDLKQKTFTRIPQIPFNSYVFDIFEDAKGNIWTGSVNRGAYYYNPKTGTQGNFRFGDTVNGHYINEFAVYNIFEDSHHDMWFATTGGGLIKLSPDWKSKTRYTTKDGLPTNVLYGILEDASGHLWISSLNGLIRLTIATGEIKVYTQANGLITDQFNYNSAYKHKDGRMYFGSVKGMIAFNPASFDQQEPSPPTYITGFQLNNKEVTPDSTSPLHQSILYTDTIVLDYNQNNFSIEFATLNYSSPEVTRYKFLMQGLDKSWTYLSTNRKAYFTDLTHGNYEFIVQAESNIGSWVGKERKLFIIITPPFWKSNTAYVLYILLLLTAIYFVTRLYRQSLERKNLRKLQLFEYEKEKEIYQAKIEFFTNITHEIQTPVTLIAGPIEWLIKKFSREDAEINKSLTIAQKNTRRLVELTNQLLDFRKTEASQFSLNFIKTDIVALLADIATSFKQQAASNNITLAMELPAAPFMAFVDREAFIKISTNLVSNAVKYAATRATVRLVAPESTDEYFTVHFINDGKAIPEEVRDQIFEPFVRVRGNNKPGTGIGLSIARSLTELHNGSLQLISGSPDLITFALQMPVHQKIEFQLGTWKKIE